jgi:hypothetical protein
MTYGEKAPLTSARIVVGVHNNQAEDFSCFERCVLGAVGCSHFCYLIIARLVAEVFHKTESKAWLELFITFSFRFHSFVALLFSPLISSFVVTL